jgi:hypothetical protein
MSHLSSGRMNVGKSRDLYQGAGHIAISLPWPIVSKPSQLLSDAFIFVPDNEDG